MRFSKAHDAAAGLSAIVAAVVLTLGVVACGSDDDGGDGNGAASRANAADTSGDTGNAAGSPEDQVRAAYAQFTDSVYATNYKAVCAQMTAKHRREIVGRGDCAKGLDTLFRGQPPRGERPKVVGLKIDGDRATLRTKSQDSPRAYPIEFVKQGGQWKVDESVSGTG